MKTILGDPCFEVDRDDLDQAEGRCDEVEEFQIACDELEVVEIGHNGEQIVDYIDDE